MSQPTSFKYIGKPRGIIDAQEKLTGQARYIGDLQMAGMLHVRLLLSPHAHARIVQMDTAAAEQVPGVKAVLTADQLTHWNKTAASRVGALLARGEVMFEGHPVVAVVADSAEAAWDAIPLLGVEYEPLPVVPDLATALAPGAPLVWPQGIPRDESNVSGDHAAVELSGADPQALPPNVHSQNDFERGNLAEGFAQSEVVLERTYRTGIVHQGYLEPQACVAIPEPMGGLTIYTGTQAPRTVHEDVSRLLDLPSSQLRVHPMTLGGGFGGKHGLMEPLAAAIALQLQAPIRLELSRTEDFMTTMPAPACEVWLKMGVDRSGALKALEAKVDVDNGAYAAAWWSALLALLLGGAYQVPNLKIHCQEVVTHKPMAGPYRAPTAQTACFALESHMDDLARELGMDPLEFRLQNASETGDPMVNGQPWPSLSIKESLQALKDHPTWTSRTTEENEAWGLALGVWPCAVGPASAVCRMIPDGTVQVQVGSADVSGVNSSLVLVAAEILSVDPAKVEIVQVDSRTGPVSPPSGGSQVTYSVSGAVSASAQEVRKQLAKLAAEHFEAAEEDLVFEDGTVHVNGLPTQRVSYAQLAKRAESRKGGAGPVIATSSNSVPENAPGVAVHAVKVHVDPETGVVTPKQYLAIQDVGRALNPLLVEGQIQGGVLQGLGWGLWEEMPYDAQGQLQAATFLDYALPRADNGVAVEVMLLENPSPHGPLGIRGVGEPPIVPGGAAIANAVYQAVQVRSTQLPIRPTTLWKQLHA